MNTVMQLHVHIHTTRHASIHTELHNMPSTTWCVNRCSDCCIIWKGSASIMMHTDILSFHCYQFLNQKYHRM